MEKIAITGGYGYGNIGDEGILASMLSSIKNKIPDAEFVILSINTNDTKRWHKNVKVVNSLDKYLDPMLWIWSVPQLLLWYIFYDHIRLTNFLTKEIRNIIEELENVDIILLSGGGYFNDTWFRAFPGRVFQFLIFKKLNKLTMIYAQTIGPFRYKLTQKIAGVALNKVNLITVRDYESKRVLDEIKVNRPEIYVTADSAILLKPAEESRINEILRDFNINTEENICIGFTIKKYTDYVSINGYKKSNQTEKTNYHVQLAKTIDHLVERYNSLIVIVPSTDWEFDRDAVNKVIKLLKNPQNVRIVDTLLPPQEFVGIIKKMDLYVSTNLHPLIFATSQNVPVVSISYWYKVDNFMKSLNLEHFNNYIHNLNSDVLIKKISYILSNKEEIQLKINQNFKELELKSQYNVELLKELATKNSK